MLGADRQGSFVVQACAVASVAAMATATLLLVWFLDHPFANETGSIQPIEMEETLRVIAEERTPANRRDSSPAQKTGIPCLATATRI